MHVTEVYSENPNLILLPTGLKIVWAERKVSVFIPTDCLNMHFPKSGKNFIIKNTLTHSNLTFTTFLHESLKKILQSFFLEKKWHSKNPEKSHAWF